MFGALAVLVLWVHGTMILGFGFDRRSLVELVCVRAKNERPLFSCLTLWLLPFLIVRVSLSPPAPPSPPALVRRGKWIRIGILVTSFEIVLPSCSPKNNRDPAAQSKFRNRFTEL